MQEQQQKEQQQNSNQGPVEGNTAKPAAIATTQDAVTTSPKAGRAALFFKVWILPLIIISIPVSLFFISKYIIFVDKSAYEKVDNLFKNKVEFVDKKEKSKETTLEEVSTPEEEAKAKSTDPVTEEKSTLEDELKTDITEKKISR